MTMRRYGQSVRNDVNYRHRPGAYGVILHLDKILLTHQAWPEAELQLPGGGIDTGESAVQALHRECMEETGWKIQIDRRLGAYQRFTYMPDYGFWAQKICHIYLCRPVFKVPPVTGRALVINLAMIQAPAPVQPYIPAITAIDSERILVNSTIAM